VRVPLGNPVSVATTSETDTCPVGDRLRILALDNDPHVLQATRALLESWGHPVACATSIDQAMALAREFSPDLAILDYRLDDDRTGLAAWSKLREFDAGMQGIVLSADRSEPVRAAVAAAGLAMLHKPLKPLALRSLLSRLSAVRSVD
jgi:DNA-binding response OmpR family regulator